MLDVLAAEWRKTRTARSTWIIIGVVAMFTGLMLLIALYFVSVWDSLPPERQAQSSLAGLPELLGWILSLCMAVFGTLAITSEFSSGMIRITFTAMPSRGRVLAAKAAIVAAFTFVLSEVALALTLVAGAAIVGDRVIIGQAPPDARAVLLIVAIGLSTTTFALIGLALGGITRSGLVSVVALALTWYIVPLAAQFAPAPWRDLLGSVVPGALAGQVAETGNINNVFAAALPPWAALVVMVGYATIPLAIATIIVGRRDA